MGIFSKAKKSGELVMVFDIRSSSVGAMLFERGGKDTPEILFSVREPIVFKKDFEINDFFIAALRALDVVAGKMSKNEIGAAKEIFCVLSSPWHAAQTRTISFKKNTLFTFTEKLANELIKKEIKLFEEEYAKNYKDSIKNIKIIEFRNMKTMLNGYATLNPVGQKARELEMTVFISICGEQILSRIKEVLAKHFHSKNIGFSSFSLASFAVMRDLLAGEESFLLADVEGEITDIAIVKEDTLKESVSFPSGINFMTRKAAELLGANFEEAKSFISLYRDGHASESAFKKMEPSMSKMKREWLAMFEEGLYGLSKDVSIPSSVILMTDPHFAGFFSEIIKNEEFNQYIHSGGKFKVAYFDPEMIESVYINRFF